MFAHFQLSSLSRIIAALDRVKDIGLGFRSGSILASVYTLSFEQSEEARAHCLYNCLLAWFFKGLGVAKAYCANGSNGESFVQRPPRQPAKRTLDSEDQSEIIRNEGKGGNSKGS